VEEGQFVIKRRETSRLDGRDDHYKGGYTIFRISVQQGKTGSSLHCEHEEKRPRTRLPLTHYLEFSQGKPEDEGE